MNSNAQHDVVDVHKGEGWDLFEWGLNSDLFEIQVDGDASPFAYDEEAVAFVERKAKEGSPRHQEALEAHRRDEPDIAKLREAERRREMGLVQRG